MQLCYVLYTLIFINESISFSVTDKLANLITDQELDFRRLQNSVAPRRRRTRVTRQRDTLIINAQTDLVNKRYFIIIYFLSYILIHTNLNVLLVYYLFSGCH